MGGFMINDVEDESRRLVMEIVKSMRLNLSALSAPQVRFPRCLMQLGESVDWL